MKNNIINTDNYELFFVDYLEGNLSSEEEIMLLAFLNENPFLNEEFQLFLNSKLEPQGIEFANKENLKRPSFSKNGINNEFDYLCIASIENDITNSEQINLNSLVENSSQNRNTLSFFLKTKLNPSTQIIYAHKSNLKRHTVLGISNRVVKITSGVAAGLLLLLGSYSIIKLTQVEQNLQVAITSPVEVPVKSSLPAKVEEPNVKVTNDNHSLKIKSNPKEKIEAIGRPEVADSMEINTNVETQSNDSEKYIMPKELLALSSPKAESNQIDISKVSSNWKSDIVPSSEIVAKKGNTKEVGIIEIAQMGINKLANYTESDLSLKASKNAEGKITRLSFESSLFAISTPIRKK